MEDRKVLYIMKEFRKSMNDGGFSDEIFEAFDKAISDMEKRNAKEPILKIGEGVVAVDYADGNGKIIRNMWKEWTCPECGWFVGEQYVLHDGRHHNQKKCKFCSKCGQAIDWKNIEKGWHSE